MAAELVSTILWVLMMLLRLLAAVALTLRGVLGAEAIVSMSDSESKISRSNDDDAAPLLPVEDLRLLDLLLMPVLLPVALLARSSSSSSEDDDRWPILVPPRDWDDMGKADEGT